MRLTVFLAFFLTISFSAYPQILPSTDSLEALLVTAPDTAKLRLYEQLYQATIHTEPEKARDYTESWIQLARELNEPTQEISALLGLGRYHYVQGHFAQAIHQSEQALLIAEALEDTARIASLYSGIGYMIFNQDKYDKALEKLFIGLRLSETLQRLYPGYP